jgi:hypothetical protein
MGFKWFGKLAGNTSAASTLATGAPSNTLTPYAAQPAGAKMLSIGEGNSSAAFNRIASALQENIEQLAGVLDSPALADTRIMAADTASYGSQGLKAVAAGATSVSLATLTAGAVAPINWVYVGLHKDRLGDFVRLYRQPSADQTGQQSYEGQNPTNAEALGMVIPTSASYWAGDGYFTDLKTLATPTYLEGVAGFRSPHSLVTYIPPIMPVVTDLPPYGGGSLSPLVQSWWNDGLSLAAYSWRDLYMKPGCFVHVKLAGANNGLYRIAHLTHNHTTTNDKAVLTRGGLHKVAVANAAVFTAGRLLCWSSYPNHTNAGLPLSAKENFAYCVYTDTTENVIYLSDLGSEEDFPTHGSGNSSGQKVDSTTGTRGTASSMGEVGQIDFETNAGSSIALRVGTLLYDADDILIVQAVLAVTPAHYPVQFDATVAAGATITPCSPLGFILNPIFTVTAGDMTGGSYMLHCKTLTTVREKMTSYGASPRWQIMANPADKLDAATFAAGQIRAFARSSKTGYDTLGDRGKTSEYPGNAFSPPAMVGGETLWQVVLTSSAGTLQAKNLPVGTVLDIAVVGGIGTTRANLVHASGNTAVLDNTDTDQWPLASRWDTIDQMPIQVGSTFVITGTTYTVDSITSAPVLTDLNGGSYVPEPGLNAVYNNLFSRNQRHRASAADGGKQAFIRVSPAAPVTAVMPTAAGPHTAFKVCDVNATTVALEVEAAGTVCQLGVDSGAWTFDDDNTAAPVPLSAPGVAGIDAILPQNILGSLNVVADHERILDVGLSDGVLTGLEVTAGALLVVNVGAGAGLYNGEYVAPVPATIPVPDNATSYVVWTLGGLDIAAGAPTAAQTPLARVTAVAGVVTSIVDCRVFLSRLDNKTDIIVGGPGSHFSSLEKAVQVVNALSMPGSGDPHKAYTIVINGPVTVLSTITFYAGNVTIRGQSGLLASGAAIYWGGNQALFDFNGKSGITLSHLSLCYLDAGAVADAVTSRVAFLNSAGTVTQLRIQSVDIWAASADRLHGYFLCTGGVLSDVRVTDCSWKDATVFGMDVQGTDIRVSNSRITGVNTNPQNSAGPVGGVLIRGGASSRVWVTDCSVTDWPTYGIYVEQAYNFTLRGNYVTDILVDVAGLGVQGIYVHSDAYRGVIADNSTVTIDGGGTALVAAGVQVAGERCRIAGNVIQPPVLGLANSGIRLAAASQYNIVTDNQTSGAGVSDVGANNGLSIGTYAQLNRDDA